MKKSKIDKISALIILNILVIYCLIKFDGLIDDFAPKHIVLIDETVINSYLDPNNYMVDQIPGFYILGAILKILTNVSSFSLLVYPIQMFPYLLVFYVFIHRLSNSHILASIVTLLQFISGTNGTGNLFFWPHGIGRILYYTIILAFILISINVETKSEYKSFKLLFIIAGISIVFVSYNLYAITILFLSVFISVSFVSSKVVPTDPIIADLNRELARLSAILIIAQFGLSKFIYETFIPTLRSGVEISASDKFLMSYLQKTANFETIFYSELIITYPGTITAISIFKYIIIHFSIILFLYSLIRKIQSTNTISFFDKLTFSYVVAYIIWAFSRLSLGQIPITVMYFPGILCIIWLYRYSNLKHWSSISIIILLFLAPIYTNLMDDIVPTENVNYTDYIKYSSIWYYYHKNVEISSVSDEFTRNLFRFYLQQDTNKDHTIQIIKGEQISNLLGVPKSQNLYYIINYKLKSFSIQNWRILKSWSYSSTKIEYNKEICKIYDNKFLSIYL